jgi:hypothetical protein
VNFKVIRDLVEIHAHRAKSHEIPNFEADF